MRNPTAEKLYEGFFFAFRCIFIAVQGNFQAPMAYKNYLKTISYKIYCAMHKNIVDIMLRRTYIPIQQHSNGLAVLTVSIDYKPQA